MVHRRREAFVTSSSLRLAMLSARTSDPSSSFSRLASRWYSHRVRKRHKPAAGPRRAPARRTVREGRPRCDEAAAHSLCRVGGDAARARGRSARLPARVPPPSALFADCHHISFRVSPRFRSIHPRSRLPGRCRLPWVSLSARSRRCEPFARICGASSTPVVAPRAAGQAASDRRARSSSARSRRPWCCSPARDFCSVQFVRLMDVKPGVNPDRVVMLRTALPQTRYPTPVAQNAFSDRLLENLRALPGVESAGLAVDGYVIGSFAASSLQYIDGIPTPMPKLGSPDFTAAVSAINGLAPLRLSGFLRNTWHPASAGADILCSRSRP